MSTQQFQPGQFCWWELATSDANAAKQFYTSLFGWTVRDIPLDGGNTYTMLEKDGKQVAALYQDKDRPTHWGSYIGVESADATVAKAKELNATVMMEPFDVMTEGRMAVLQDPTGAVFSVWEPKNHKGAAHVNDVGGVVWNELMTPDAGTANKFYGDLFGYGINTMPYGGSDYTILSIGESQTAGVMEITSDMPPGMPPHWSAYFAVENTQSAADTAAKLGGNVMVPPTPIAGVGIFAVLSDPQGGVFSVLEPDMSGNPSNN